MCFPSAEQDRVTRGLEPDDRERGVEKVGVRIRMDVRSRGP